MREDLTRQKGAIIEELMKINPGYQPPADFIKQKPFKKLYIPYREFPTYNFIGLIIGPRGNTQKQLEAETGCKISIRGRLDFITICHTIIITISHTIIIIIVIIIIIAITIPLYHHLFLLSRLYFSSLYDKNSSKSMLCASCIVPALPLHCLII
jgi:hypothetical protein